MPQEGGGRVAVRCPVAIDGRVLQGCTVHGVTPQESMVPSRKGWPSVIDSRTPRSRGPALHPSVVGVGAPAVEGLVVCGAVAPLRHDTVSAECTRVGPLCASLALSRCATTKSDTYTTSVAVVAAVFVQPTLPFDARERLTGRTAKCLTGRHVRATHDEGSGQAAAL